MSFPGPRAFLGPYSFPSARKVPPDPPYTPTQAATERHFAQRPLGPADRAYQAGLLERVRKKIASPGECAPECAAVKKCEKKCARS